MQIAYKPVRRIYGKTKGKIQTQSKVPPIDFNAKTGLAVEYSISGNMTQASTQEYSITDIPPIDFQSDGSGISAYSIYGNMMQAASQQYSLTGTSPLSFKSDANTLSAWSIAGNMTQTGTPTPSAPITPEECGDKTANLFPLDATKLHIGRIENDGTIDYEVGTITVGTNSVTYQANATWRGFYTDYIQADENATLTFSPNYSSTISWACSCYDENGNFLGKASARAINLFKTFTTLAGTKKVRLSVSSSATEYTITNPMFNTGDTALPYEPFGYKIPITNAGQTVTAYLAEPICKIGDYVDVVDSSGVVTRRIKKLVLTGEETSWNEPSIGIHRLTLVGYMRENTNIPLCTHYIGTTPVSEAVAVGNLRIAFLISASDNNYMYIRDPAYTSIADFKTYLSQQYANGTPVCVWYVLATAQTETFTAPTIPTTSGDNTLSIDTTLSPSSVSITTTSGVWTENPIIPEETGDKTANLFDDDNAEFGKWVNSNGTIATNATYAAGYDIKVGTASEFAVKYYGDKPYSYSMAFYDSNGDFLSRTHRSNPSASYDTFSVPENAVSARFQVACATSDVMTSAILKAMKLMLNSGSTALPYEPYGYKIPVTNAGTTTNIYALEPLRKIGDYADVVGSTGTITRIIKKLVFTGTENVSYNARNDTRERYAVTIPAAGGTTIPENVICTHFKTVDATTKPLSEGGICMRNTGVDVVVGGTYTEIGVTSPSDSPTITSAVKAYLAAQYAAGTPVTVWYVLATPTTETITSPTITTVSGSNTLSIGTTLQPSNVSLTTSSSVYPLNPIIPEEVGERTGNLAPPLTEWVDGYINNGTGTIHEPSAAQEKTSPFINIKDVPRNNYLYMQYEGGDFPNGGSGSVWTCIGYYDNNKILISRPTSGGEGSVKQYTMPENAAYCRASFRTYGETGNISLSSGTEPPSYEPYGYKIPLNLNNTISNIYLSQPIRKIGNYSDSIDYENGTVTRNIKNLVLTGQESWVLSSAQTSRFLRSLPGYLKSTGNITYICSHYNAVAQRSSGTVPNNSQFFYSGSDSTYYIFIVDENCSTATDFKAYLAQQYSNGTPVCVWYVLETPEVEQITPPTITPSIESNTISVDTTLQPSNLSITYTSPDYSEIKLVYDNQGNILYNDPPYHDWGAVRWIVRQGLGPQYYPIGYIFYDNFNPETGTAFQVVAYDNHFDPALTAQGYTHSMTLCEVLLDDVITMDAIEAFLYTNQAIPAGTYKFTIPNYDASYGGNKTYYFTSTAELPANSQIVMNWPYNQTPKTVTGYAPTASLTAMENTTAATGWSALTLTEWVDGTSPAATDLGTIAGPTTQAGSSSYCQMNHIHRARYGSNNYLQSGARQFLNSDKAGGQWWTPQTVFDRPYGSRNSAGKLTKLRSDFISVLATPTIQSRTNSYFETTSLDGTTFTLSTNYDITTDKLFLLSPMEVGFSTTDTTVGTLLDYYINATNGTRIKKRKSNDAAYYWWLRTPNPSHASSVRYVASSGALGSYYASDSYGVPAAACIQ